MLQAFSVPCPRPCERSAMILYVYFSMKGNIVSQSRLIGPSTASFHTWQHSTRVACSQKTFKT